MKFQLSISYRRLLLDECLQAAIPYMQGRVLDIGGMKMRKRGDFRPPRDEQWYYLNIVAGDRPDVQGSAHLLPLADDSVDTVICTEVLEHLGFPRQAISEIYRVLRPGGYLILSAPLLVHFHGDPYDFYRFTVQGLQLLFFPEGFHLMRFEPMGFYFTVLADMLRHPLAEVRPAPLRWLLGGPFVLVMATLQWLERRWSTPLMRSYTTGHFVIARKEQK